MVPRLDDQPGIRHWIAVFVSQDPAYGFYFWQLITGRKWAHVWLFGLSDCGYIVLNPRGHHLYIEHFWSNLDPYQFLSAATVGQNIVGAIEIEKPVYISWKTNLHSVYSCVSVVKDVLGVRKWGIFTPKQLYDHLLTIGTKLEFSLHKDVDFGILGQQVGENEGSIRQ